MKFRKRMMLGLAVVLSLSFGFSLADTLLISRGVKGESWRTAPSYSAGIAPDPAEHADIAIV